MSYGFNKKRLSQWAKPEYEKNNNNIDTDVKVCDLGINGTIKPCCVKDTKNHECHIKPSLLDHTKRLTRSNSLQMTKEHDAYKKIEMKILGVSGMAPSKYDISRRYRLKGLAAVKNEQDGLKEVIKMRKNWLKKWYIPPSPRKDCYSCDANSRNHNARIDILTQSIDDYENVINENVINENTSKVKTTIDNVGRPKLNITRKNNHIDIIDPVTRRQKLVAMLAKRQMTQKYRRNLSSNNQKSSNKNRTSSNKNRTSSNKNRTPSNTNRNTANNKRILSSQ
jgi:hypothetical protein